ncbi:MAG: PAS domain-containing protein [Gammaproteobacteria bacterium]|nr:PAS domain-containing protein [Gammaproteobacteria bacterium]MBT8445466.1 PAS domain-containing protein [Gammaproteobacteria bacterium]NND36830.1 PAS domain-containing protein [Gammaproteobacteria bacterium]
MKPVASADAILEQLGTAVAIVDGAGEIRYLNLSAESLFGVSRRQSIGSTMDVLAPDLEDLAHLIVRALVEERSFGRDIAVTLPRRDYQVAELTCRVAPLGEERQHALVEFVDATQSRQFEREKALINQRVASKRIIRQLAHEIRNPLGGLRGAAQLLQRQLDAPDLREYTQVIIGEADRLTALTEGLLGPTRSPEFTPLNMHEVIERVLLLTEAEAPAGIEIVRDYDPSLPEIKADRDQLIQALLNLARNGVQALGESGRLTVRTRVLMNFVIGEEFHRLIASIEIEDNGPGISPDIEESIFFPLVTDRDGGTGFGLPLAQDIVRRHGGLIEFDSDPGRTVFMVRLPMTSTRRSERDD